MSAPNADSGAPECDEDYGSNHWQCVVCGDWHCCSAHGSYDDPAQIDGSVPFGEACRTIVRHGYTPVNTERYERLRAWLDQNGWPPKDWQPAQIDGYGAAR